MGFGGFLGSCGGYFWGFRGNLGLGYFGDILCVATRNLLLKRLAIWVLGDFWGLGGVFLGFSGKFGFGVFWRYFVCSHSQSFA